MASFLLRSREGDRDKEEKDFERAACKEFLKQYNKLKGTGYKFRGLGDPSEGHPDCFALWKGVTLGIEITTAYYGKEEAKREWCLRRGGKKSLHGRPDGDVGRIIKEPDARIKKEVGRLIRDKCLKKYSGANKLILCVYFRGPISSDKATINEIARKTRVPLECTFHEIFLFFHRPAHEGNIWSILSLLPRQ
jgi:hypothetical protein